MSTLAYSSEKQCMSTLTYSTPSVKVVAETIKQKLTRLWNDPKSTSEYFYFLWQLNKKRWERRESWIIFVYKRLRRKLKREPFLNEIKRAARAHLNSVKKALKHRAIKVFRRIIPSASPSGRRFETFKVLATDSHGLSITTTALSSEAPKGPDRSEGTVNIQRESAVKSNKDMNSIFRKLANFDRMMRGGRRKDHTLEPEDRKPIYEFQTPKENKDETEKILEADRRPSDVDCVAQQGADVYQQDGGILAIIRAEFQEKFRFGQVERGAYRGRYEEAYRRESETVHKRDGRKRVRDFPNDD
jgi:hypothetical protein